MKKRSTQPHGRRRSARPAALVVPVIAGLVPPAGLAAPGERDLSLTVYNNDLAVVRDARTLAIESGTHWLPFTDVPARIDPTSVHLKAADGQDLAVLEQNYRYDLVSQEAILERYLDHPIRVVLEDGRLFEGELLSYAGGRLVLRAGPGQGGAERGAPAPDASGQGGLVILNPEKVTDVQCPALPAGLITRPTLEWLLETGRGGERRLEVSYLTGGFNWHAEYVAVVAANDAAMDLAGWVSVDNRSGAAYDDAALQLVAGDIHRVPKGGMPRPEMMMDANLARAAAPQFEEEALFEYHLYTLARRTTLRDNETKQVSLFTPTACKVRKIFEANPRRDGTKVRVVLEATNSEKDGLGMPLPKGTVRVYKKDTRERLQFVGEDAIDHTPRDEDIRIFVGNAFDLVVERTETDMRRISQQSREVDVKIEVRNRKEREDVVVVVQEDLYGGARILRASQDYESKSAYRVEFPVPVKAGQVATVTFTVRYGY